MTPLILNKDRKKDKIVPFQIKANPEDHAVSITQLRTGVLGVRAPRQAEHRRSHIARS